MGRLQHNFFLYRRASGRRLGRRTCLRKACGCTFLARRQNQRYCQRPHCLREVRRWQSAKRQGERRRRPEVRAAHAEAERKRRARRRADRRDAAAACVLAECALTECALQPDEQMAPDANPAPRDDSDRRAWSRSKKFSGPFCDRPGCYDAVRASCRCQARYCGDECRGDVRRVHDRERKWLARNTPAGRFKRGCEYQAARCSRRARAP